MADKEPALLPIANYESDMKNSSSAEDITVDLDSNLQHFDTSLENDNQDSLIAYGLPDETSKLQELAATVRDQDELEKDLGRQADQMLLEQADERDQRRLRKTLSDKEKLLNQIKKLQQRLKNPMTATSSTRLQAEIDHLRAEVENLNKDFAQIQQRIDDRHNKVDEDESREHGGNRRMPGESQREFLIRTGKITPFSKVGTSLLRSSSNLADVMLDAEEQDDTEEFEDGDDRAYAHTMSHRNLLEPGFADNSPNVSDSSKGIVARRARKRRKMTNSNVDEVTNGNTKFSGISESDKEYTPEQEDETKYSSADEESDGFSVVVQGSDKAGRTTKNGPIRRIDRGYENSEERQEDLAGLDDGNEQLYQSRLSRWTKSRREARNKALAKASNVEMDEDLGASADGTVIQPPDSIQEEWFLPHPTRDDAEFDGGFRIPGDIYPSLFDYQKTGVQWLSELYSQQVGGIIGDEMGLGKTIQIISFLAGLHYSKKLTKPIIVVTPATVMKQWVNEFHRWWPPLRVSILHTSGSGMMNLGRENRLEHELETSRYNSNSKIKVSGKAAKKIVNRVINDGHVLVTTYSGLQTYADILIPVNWEYAILDEGHKIRNPNTSITIHCKELRTANRVILSGTPMQNNLIELWSLFDFIFPMRLGTLVNFRAQFEIPIRQGGYANASNLEVETALKCAETLKDAISPYLLQRFKIDVAADLPKKTEQVLFCKLTKTQRDIYESFLGSEEMTSILNGKRQALYGIDMLRKVCNHPDLTQHRTLSIKPGYNYGNGNKSGKMQVVKALLQLWRDTGHKTLLFAQHRIMLDILEKFIKSIGNFNYRRMDGNTQIKNRQDMVDEFNGDPSIHVFLLTTKVGGLGVNLTGADRVIIYDPDWNPSTDVQARERAWRLGQKREVMIYRLMTAGTIEEKIYHRQIFKQILTNKILRDPKQRQTFHLKDLHDLFTLGDANEEQTETGGLFKGTEVHFEDDDQDDQALAASPKESDDPSKVAAIVGVSRRENFQTDSDDTNSQATSPTTDKVINKPSRVLSSIFARSGVQAAHEHDAIISGSASGKGRKITADPVMIAREARKVAAQAAKELQRAGEAARFVPVGTPTWTGEFGIAGRPEARPVSPLIRGGSLRGGRYAGRGGLASSTVLSNLAIRQGLQPSAPSQASQQPPPRGKEFMALIRDYLLAMGGRCYSQNLIDHFNRYCNGSEQRTAEFTEMLKAIAQLDKNGARGARGGRGVWVLRKEFGGEA